MGTVVILELAERLGLKPKRVSASEYCSSCPACFGIDRFRIWTTEHVGGRYWCRRCNRKGDSIQFAREFLGVSFAEARDFIGASVQRGFYPKPIPKVIQAPSCTWQSRAEEFVEACHKRLMIDPEAVAYLKEKYGLIRETLRQFKVGWSPEQRFDHRSSWGLQEDEKKLWLCLPRGIVIPAFRCNGVLFRIKIRRLEWIEGERFSKYSEISGGSNLMPVYGFRMNQVAVVVESELDAMTLCQEIGDFCTVVATGGASKRPDQETSEWLQSRKLILYAQDFDPAGCENFDWWRSIFPNVHAWLAETRKSPTDSFVLDGVNLNAWWLAGIEYCK